MSNDRSILEQTLGEMLGFDDGVSGVLEHLLTIESRDDLAEYLMQLLGDGSTPEISEFVDSVGKYNRKEPLNLSSEHKQFSADSGRNIKPLPISPSPSPSVDVQSAKPMPPMSKQSKQEAMESRRNQKLNKSRTPPPKMMKQVQVQTQEIVKISGEEVAAKKSALQVQTQEIKKPSEGTAAEKSASKGSPNSKPDEQDRVEKLGPSRGEAKKVCGCFGNFHKSLTNCLHCGRISCVEEGFDFCSFCGYMVESVDNGQDHSQDPSWQLKERMLGFDRETKRREVVDDQADFQGPSTWMTAEERDKAEENEQKQLDSLKRAKQLLNIAL